MRQTGQSWYHVKHDKQDKNDKQDKQDKQNTKMARVATEMNNIAERAGNTTRKKKHANNTHRSTRTHKTILWAEKESHFVDTFTHYRKNSQSECKKKGRNRTAETLNKETNEMHTAYVLQMQVQIRIPDPVWLR